MVKDYDKNKTGGTFIPCKKIYCVYDSVAVGSTPVTGIRSLFNCGLTGKCRESGAYGTKCQNNNRDSCFGCNYSFYM